MAAELVQRGGFPPFGFSFIEMLVAMLILGTAVFAHLGLQGQLFVDTQTTQRYLLAHGIGLEWWHYVHSELAVPGLKGLTGGAPPVVTTSCLNRYCTRAELAAYQAALIKCHVSQYANSSGCVKVAERDALLPRYPMVNLPSGEVTATVDGMLVTVAWRSSPLDQTAVVLGRRQ